MAMSLPNSAGIRLRQIAQGAQWVRDGGTMPESWAEEIEHTLQFLDGQGQFQPRLNSLRGNWRQLNGVLAEGRTGRFLDSLGFRILAWEPPSLTGYPGDLLVQWKALTPIFVEVKGPDWEGEFQSQLPNHKFLKRKALGKQVDGEAGAVSPVGMPFQVIRDNAMKKFAPNQPNMVVIVDGLLVSPANARGVIDSHVEKFFGEPQTDKLGAILFLLAECPAGGQVRYRSNFYTNPLALAACLLPEHAAVVLNDRAVRDWAERKAEATNRKRNRRKELAELSRKLCG